jgi:glycosyltransferase involved in cell wall biosynthesis
VRVHAYDGESRWSVPVLPPLDTPETLRAGMNRARLTLEPALLDDAQGRYRGAYRITPRAFFAASCGVPSLIEAFDGLGEFFEPGLEIAAFTSPEDAVLQAERLLSDETARAAMGRRARQRALRQHTWDWRVEDFQLDVREWKTRPGVRPPR